MIGVFIILGLMFLSALSGATLIWEHAKQKGIEQERHRPHIPTTNYLIVNDNQVNVSSGYNEEDAITDAKYAVRKDHKVKLYIYKKIKTVSADIPVKIE